MSVPCNLYMEELKEAVGIELHESCTICGLVGARHTRRDGPLAAPTTQTTTTSNSKISMSGVAQAYLKLKEVLPTWSKTSTDVRSYLKKVELVLRTNDGIPEACWPRAFLYTVSDYSSLEWIQKHIIEKDLSWPQARQSK